MIIDRDIEVYKDTLERFESSKNIIVDRIEEIIKLIAKIFNRKVSGWWLPGAREGELGDLGSCIVSPHYKDGSDEVEFETDWAHDMATDEWDYAYSFPRKFLFMNDGDVRAEIKGQIKETEANAIREKEKRAQKAAEKKKFKEAAAKKLTKQERKALGIKN